MNCAAHLADVVCTRGGDRVTDHLLAADAHERLLHTPQKARLRNKQGGEVSVDSLCAPCCTGPQYLAAFFLLWLEEVVLRTTKQPSITLQGEALEEVESFSYLSSVVGQSAKVEKEVAVRLKKAGKVYQMWRRKVFRSRNRGKET